MFDFPKEAPARSDHSDIVGAPSSSVSPRRGPANFNALTAFVAGTRIGTQSGLCRVEDLSIGDRILTRENGYQPVIWRGTHHISAATLRTELHLAPIRFDAGACDSFEPNTPVLVAPRHRILHRPDHAESVLGQSEVLVAARAFVNGASIRPVIPDEGVTYVHVMCAEPQVVLGEAGWSETMSKSAFSKISLTPEQRAEIRARFPDFAIGRARTGSKSARRLISPKEFAARSA